MRYILASAKLAQAAGLKLEGHKRNQILVAFNEKEIMIAPSLSRYQTLEDKASAIGGSIHSRTEMVELVNQNKLKI